MRLLEALERRLDQGQWLLAKKEAERLLHLPEGTLSAAEKGRVYFGYGRACTWLQEYYAAAWLLEKALGHAFQATDWDTLGFCRANLGMVLLAIGDLSAASESFATYYLDIPRYKEARSVEAFARYNNGLTLRRQKRHAEALVSYQMALNLFIQKGRTREAGKCHQNMAWAYLLEEKTDEAFPHLECAHSFVDALSLDYRAEMHVCWAFYHFQKAEIGTAVEYALEILEGAQPGAGHRHKSQTAWIAGEVALVCSNLSLAYELGRIARAHAIESKESELMNRASELLRKARPSDGGQDVAAR